MDWEPNDPGIEYLVGRGRLDRITPRPEAAAHLLGEAPGTHRPSATESARAIHRCYGVAGLLPGGMAFGRTSVA